MQLWEGQQRTVGMLNEGGNRKNQQPRDLILKQQQRAEHSRNSAFSLAASTALYRIPGWPWSALQPSMTTTVLVCAVPCCVDTCLHGSVQHALLRQVQPVVVGADKINNERFPTCRVNLQVQVQHETHKLHEFRHSGETGSINVAWNVIGFKRNFRLKVQQQWPWRVPYAVHCMPFLLVYSAGRVFGC